ncbi:hypothetical protein TEA_012961 [Camellia sinensis var. sinensis]|uniref:Thioredoxin domain-containing protein n=1 Tax=Camellia sinensis var. sinensis TaxID=542762 RepID=A0A4S4F3A0_CAMSN|nr:hypothetical protein TEA_012961 [Camellia sinensis var. sinensis]
MDKLSLKKLEDQSELHSPKKLRSCRFSALIFIRTGNNQCVSDYIVVCIGFRLPRTGTQTLRLRISFSPLYGSISESVLRFSGDGHCNITRLLKQALRDVSPIRVVGYVHRSCSALGCIGASPTFVYCRNLNDGLKNCCLQLAVEYESNAIIVKVDTDDEYEFARDMQVRGLPTLYFISPDPNKDAIRTEGLIPIQMMRDIIDNQM